MFRWSQVFMVVDAELELSMSLFSSFLLSNIDLSLLFHYQFPTLLEYRIARTDTNHTLFRT